MSLEGTVLIVSGDFHTVKKMKAKLKICKKVNKWGLTMEPELSY